MSQFKKIYSIQFKHLYYGTNQNDFINDFDIIPSLDTEVILKNYGMVMKQTSDSLVVLGETISGGTQLLRAVGATTKFRFYLKLKTKTFHNFTDIPLTGNDGKIYYFNNAESHIPGSGDLTGNLILLSAAHTTDYVDGAERLEALPELFIKNIPSSYNQVKIEDVYDSSNVVFDSGTTFLAGDIQFDLRGKVRPGRYKLTQSGIPIGNEFYIDSKAGSGVFGVIEILEVHGSNAPYKYVDNTGTIINPTYVLAFKNRSTIWKYFVKVNDTMILPPNSLRIGNAPVSFSTPLVSGSQAIFTSLEIPLLHKTYQNIILYQMVSDNGVYDSGTDIAVILNMPNPSVDIVKPGTYPAVYSEIFVYV